jgi:hypothetical protein
MIRQAQLKDHKWSIGRIVESDVGALPLAFDGLFDSDRPQSHGSNEREGKREGR